MGIRLLVSLEVVVALHYARCRTLATAAFSFLLYILRFAGHDTVPYCATMLLLLQVSDRAKARGAAQCGTLGSGNHYCEVQVG